ncbi:hypothetical protein OPQ81_005110 [Rhizoctonia solani]|nr:hypothetical protein OPQ81_005110 [Rhizoctonia solani]
MVEQLSDDKFLRHLRRGVAKAISSELLEVLNLKGQINAGMDCMRLTTKLCKRLEGQPKLAKIAEDAK